MLNMNNIISENHITDITKMSGIANLWSETLGDPRICIAILDGPVDDTHPSLVNANLTHVETAVTNVIDRSQSLLHGTHVTSIIFGQHNEIVRGVAPACCGLIVPIFHDQVGDSDSGSAPIATCSQVDLAKAIFQSVEHGAHIINISGGQLTPFGEAHPLLANAVRHCVANNVLIVAAAGNDGCDCLHVPGSLPSVLAVGAMDASNFPLDSSNWGEKYQDQGILAPGENIVGASPGGGTITNSGTSFATAVVSGIVALFLSLQVKRGEKPDAQVIQKAILNSALGCEAIDKDTLECRRLLVGRLSINGVLSSIMQEKNIILKVGDRAPDFSAKDQTNSTIRLSDYQEKLVVVWFYPQADTPG